MSHSEPQIEQEEQEIKLLKEWLPKISSECRAYIKGAAGALLYAQESGSVPAGAEPGEVGA